VDSLATVPLIRAGPGGDLLLDAPLDGGIPRTPDARGRLAAAIRKDRIAPRSLISGDERVFALNLIFEGDVDGDRETAVAAVREVLGEARAAISGVPVVRAEAGTETRSEVLLFVPLTILLVGGVLAVLFRDGRAVWIALCVSGAGTALCLGAMGATGVTLSVSTMLLPPVMLALGCAYAMHVLAAARGRNRLELERALQKVARPIALSGLTTAIGFLAMATVRIGLIRDLATFGALGVVCITGAALTLAPALLARRPLVGRRVPVEHWIQDWLRPLLVRTAVRRRRAVIAGWLLVTALFGLGVGRITVSSDVIRWFPRDSELRRSYEWIREKLSGITPVNVIVEAEGGKVVTEPEVVERIDALARELEALPKVGRALSVADPLRQIHGVFTGEADPGLPQRRDLIEQYLMLLEGVDQIYDVVTRDRTGANVLLRVDNNESVEIVEIADWVDGWWAEHGLPGYRVATTGIMYQFGRGQEEIAWGQIRGLSLAALTIAALLLLIFGDLRVAAVALVPNALPIPMVFGFMGLAGIALDAGTACVSSLALGIAVDDTLHVVAGFRDETARGRPPAEALDHCFRLVLPAVVFTTVTISVSFGVLGLSDLSLVRNLGLVTAGTVVVCLLADLVLLPALLLGAASRRPL
jgi:predicted RND superfamily exporter protein